MLPENAKTLPLGMLHLSSRSHNLLNKAKIDTIGDLFLLSESDLANIPQLGSKYLSEIQKTKKAFQESIMESEEIDWVYFWDKQGIKTVPHQFTPDTIESEILSSLASIVKEILEQNFDERLWFIIQRRFGLEGTPKLTLEELGLAFGLTRERVRQIERFALYELRAVLIEDNYKDKFYHVHPIVLNIVRKLSEFAIEATSQAILESNLLSQIDNHFSIQSDKLKPSLSLILELNGLTKLDFNRSHLQPIWNSLETSESRLVHNYIKLLDKLLTEEYVLPLSEIDILIRINKVVRKKHQLTLEQLRKWMNLCSSIEKHSEGFYWGKFENLGKRTNQIERILFEQGEPVHINEIVREINHRLAPHGKKIVGARNLANQMSSDDRFVPIGRSGEWGLSSWSVDTGTIVELMKQYLVIRNIPATVEEIYLYISERRPVQKSSIVAYLSFQEEFAKVDRTKWGLVEWSETKYAQIWNPEQVGQFVEELFRKNRARKLNYQIVKQALVEASGVKPRQAQGLLNTNPVIRTERDETGELFAIFQVNYKDILTNTGARFVRRGKTLREKVGEAVHEILNNSPGNQIALSELVRLLVEKFNRIDKTFYSYISRLDYVEKFEIPSTNTVMCRLKREPSSLPFPQVEDIQTLELRQKVGRALTFLNENDVDIALFLLSKEFEATLKNYLSSAQARGRFSNIPLNRLNLDTMINFVKSENIITDQAVLHFLRQKRNDRAHGSMPKTEERRVMMKYAETTAGMYIDYIKYFDDLEHAL